MVDTYLTRANSLNPEGMTPENIIKQGGLHEARETSRVQPEAYPSNLMSTFRDHHEVKVYTNDDNSVWLFVSKAERRFLLQAPITGSVAL